MKHSPFTSLHSICLQFSGGILTFTGQSFPTVYTSLLTNVLFSSRWVWSFMLGYYQYSCVILTSCILVTLTPCILTLHTGDIKTPCIVVTLTHCILVTLTPCILVTLTHCILVKLILVTLTLCSPHAVFPIQHQGS